MLITSKLRAENIALFLREKGRLYETGRYRSFFCEGASEGGEGRSCFVF